MNFEEIIYEIANSETPIWNQLEFMQEGKGLYRDKIIDLFNKAIIKKEEMMVYALEQVGLKTDLINPIQRFFANF